MRVRPTLQSIQRESSSRRIDVDRGRERTEPRAPSRMTSGTGIRSLTFPLEYHAEVIGRRDRDAGHCLAACSAFGLAAAIGIFLLLQAAFGSWRLASWRS